MTHLGCAVLCERRNHEVTEVGLYLGVSVFSFERSGVRLRARVPAVGLRSRPAEEDGFLLIETLVASCPCHCLACDDD